MRRLITVVVVAIAISGCATGRTLEVSGAALEGLGEQFVSVTKQVKSGCDAKVISPVTCTKYRVFGERFKQTFPVTVGVWEAARKANDIESERKAAAVAQLLANELTQLAIEALNAFAPEK